MDNWVNINTLVGKTITHIERKDIDRGDVIFFQTSDGKVYKMYHRQDCCESVYLEDIDGELNDLLNTPILQAEEVTNSEDKRGRDMYESFTWTFYKFATTKGYVTLRWLGESNGYYSEGVDFVEMS